MVLSGNFDEGSVLKFEIGQNQGPWGIWGKCSDGEYVIGFRTKVQDNDHNDEDDTSLNAIEITCSNNQTKTSLEGPWGSWGEKAMCQSGFNQASIQIHEKNTVGPSGELDNTGVNTIRLYCEQLQEWMKSKEGGWGTWEQENCKDKYYICGVRTRVEPMNGNENVALNNIEFLCCKIINPKHVV